jgi:hypothetical protein
VQDRAPGCRKTCFPYFSSWQVTSPLPVVLVLGGGDRAIGRFSLPESTRI